MNRQPFEFAPQDGRRIHAFGRGNYLHLFRYDRVENSWLQFVAAKDMQGTWHQPFFAPQEWEDIPR